MNLSLPYIPGRAKKILLATAAFVCLTVLLTLATPGVSYAIWPFDFFSDALANFGDWVQDLFKTGVQWELNTAIDNLNDIGANSIVTSKFADFFTDNGEITNAAGETVTIYSLCKNVATSIVNPVASDILALVMLVQLVKISQKVDASATLPTVKEIVVLAVMFVVFTYLINHSFEICRSMYNGILNQIITPINEYASDATANPIDLGLDSYEPGQLICALLVGFIVLAVSMVASVVAYFIAYARAIQIYIMAAFSPIPLALMGFEETRSFGINYLKNFLALCLAGAIIVLILIMFPLVLNAAIGLGGDDLMGHCIDCMVVSILLVASLIKSGSVARDILGG